LRDEAQRIVPWPTAACVVSLTVWVFPALAPLAVLTWSGAAAVMGLSARRMQAAGARQAWGILAAAAGLASIGNVVRAVHGLMIGSEFPFPSAAADPLIVLGYLAFVLAQIRFITARGTGRDLDAWLGAATLATALGFTLWVAFISDYAFDPSEPAAERIVNVLYFCLQALLLTTTIRLLVAPGVRAQSYHLLAACSAVLVASDLAGSTASAQGADPLPFVAANTVAAGFALAAVLHPSAERLTATPDDIEPPDEGRVWPYTWWAMIIPVLILTLRDRLSPADRIEALMGAVIIFSLVSWRAIRLVRSRSRLLARADQLIQIGTDLKGRPPDHLDRALLLHLDDLVGNEVRQAGILDQHDETSHREWPAMVIDALSGGEEVRAAVDRGQLFALAAPHRPGLWVVVVTEGILDRHDRLAVRSLVRSWSAAHQAHDLLEERHQRRADRRFRALVQDSGDVVALIQADALIVTMVSPSMQRILGYHEAEFLSGSPARLLHRDDRAAVEDLLANAVVRPQSAPIDVRVRHVDGHYHWFSVTVRDLTNDEEIGGLVMNLTDIHDRKMAEMSLTYSEQRYRDLVLNSKDVLAVLEPDLTVGYISPNVEELLGFPTQDLVATTISNLLTEESTELFTQFLDEARGDLQNDVVELELRTTGRRNRIGEITLSERDGGGYTVSIRDVTEQRRLERNLRDQALYDGLTGLANRSTLHFELQQRLQRLRAAEYLGIIHLDINDFKTVNESVGYESGDDLLVEVAARLRASLRSTDLLARIGGNEFAIALITESEEEVERFARRIDHLFDEPFEVAGRPQRLAVSIGFHAAGDRRTVARTLLDAASLALGAARTGSQRNIRVFEPSLRASATERFELGADLGCAIARDELSVVYQPIVEIATRKVRGVEALLRWTHPQRGVISPGVFIPLAEKSGLVVELGRWVMAEACRQLQVWHETVPYAESLSMSVNVSALQLERPGEAATLAETVKASGVKSHQVTVELTESTLIEDADWIRSQLAILRDLGVRVAVDDFGTGAAGLSHLRDVPFNVVKIDRSYVREVRNSDEATNLVRGVIALAHSVGAETVAEGIEYPEEFDLLHSLGCELGQGFWLAYPMDPVQLEEWFAEGQDGSAPALLARPRSA
jgi:diguanylate cyclase (GGDEF)-like protein/PAS domain S-box-containing protein